MNSWMETPTCGCVLLVMRYLATFATWMVSVMSPSVGLVRVRAASVPAEGGTFPGEDVHVRHPARDRGVAV